MASAKAAEFLSVFTRSRFGAIQKTIMSLRRKIESWVRSEGLSSLCLRIKDSEKSYLLTGTTKWFSLKYLKKPGVSEMGIRTLFTLHRNMKVKPRPNFASIRHVGTELETFLSSSNNAMAFRRVCESRLFEIPKRATLKELMVKINLTTHPL